MDSLSGLKTYRLTGFRAQTTPDVMPLRMRYIYVGKMTCASNVAERVFRCNSIFDPDQTLGTGEVGAYADWATLYNNYRVVAVKWRVAVTSSGNGQSGWFVVFPDTATGALMSGTECANLRMAKNKLVPAGGSAPILTGTWHIAKLFGVSEEAILTDNNYQTGMGSNPAFQYYLHVGIYCPDTAAGAFDVQVDLEYYVRLEGPNQLGQLTLRRKKTDDPLDTVRSVAIADAPLVVGRQGFGDFTELLRDGSLLYYLGGQLTAKSVYLDRKLAEAAEYYGCSVEDLKISDDGHVSYKSGVPRVSAPAAIGRAGPAGVSSGARDRIAALDVRP